MQYANSLRACSCVPGAVHRSWYAPTAIEASVTALVAAPGAHANACSMRLAGAISAVQRGATNTPNACATGARGAVPVQKK